MPRETKQLLREESTPLLSHIRTSLHAINNNLCVKCHHRFQSAFGGQVELVHVADPVRSTGYLCLLPTGFPQREEHCWGRSCHVLGR